jgi:NADPH:quinone reductase-like Zn-dependent oxidoreductase
MVLVSKLVKTIAYERYGNTDVMKIIDIPIPKPDTGQILVNVHAAALNPKDYLVRKGLFKWLTRGGFPKIPGLDFAGTIAEVGPNVELSVGTPIYGSLNEISTKRGTLTEFLLIDQTECAPKPNALSFVEAAAIPLAGQTALQALQDLIHLKSGQKILILGASGGVGVYAIQIAKAMGAHVTTTSSEGNKDFCKSLGADIALDYRVDNPFAQQDRYDAIFDAFGNQSFSKAEKSLKPEGVYVNTVPSLRILWDYVRTLFSGKRAKMVLVRSNTEDLNELAAMVETGTLKPVIDSVYEFDNYREAFKRIESRHARGKVVVKVSEQGLQHF